MTAEDLIGHLNLVEHPEGGYYREVYRSSGIIRKELPGSMEGSRNYATSIYFLLTNERFSAFHRIRQDEIWYYHLGSPIDIHILHDKSHRTIHLGTALHDNQVLQAVVPAGAWFAAEVMSPGSYGLVSCMVAPGFDFQDFELADRDRLMKEFPDHAALIQSFTR